MSDDDVVLGRPVVSATATLVQISSIYQSKMEHLRQNIANRISGDETKGWMYRPLAFVIDDEILRFKIWISEVGEVDKEPEYLTSKASGSGSSDEKVPDSLRIAAETIHEMLELLDDVSEDINNASTILSDETVEKSQISNASEQITTSAQGLEHYMDILFDLVKPIQALKTRPTLQLQSIARSLLIEPEVSKIFKSVDAPSGHDLRSNEQKSPAKITESQPSNLERGDEASMQDFDRMLRACTLKACCGRNYILPSKFKEWLQKSRAGPYNMPQFARLHQATYQNWSHPAHPMPSERIIEDDCLFLFSILLEMDRGELIHELLNLGKTDRDLPINLYALSLLFQDTGIQDYGALADSFNERQWKYCPAILEFNIQRQYPENQVMPFRRRAKINEKGGTAQMWQIEVLEDFVGPKLRERVRESKYDLDDGLGPRYEFALKTFEDGNKGFFQNERDAFLALLTNRAMIQYLGSYSNSEVDSNEIEEDDTTMYIDRSASSWTPGIVAPEKSHLLRMTHNILLEYAESDLEEYFVDNQPPAFQPEVEAFWGGLVEVSDAIRGIHNLKTNYDGKFRRFNGWHAEIKPDNILLVHGKFKLADPGFVKWIEKSESKLKDVPNGGTVTFGAPEIRGSWNERPSEVDQSIDIWSLACTFSVAATWVVLGYQGIRQFDKLREKAISSIMKQEADFPRARRLRPYLTKGNAFHDSIQVLTAVTGWHKFLRDALRRTDMVTGRILDLVDHKMLLRDPKNRIDADELCRELKTIIEEGKSDRRIPVPLSIRGLLMEVDEEAPRSYTQLDEIAAVSSNPKPETITSDRKLKFLEPALQKTAQRSEVMRSSLTPQVNTALLRHKTQAGETGEDRKWSSRGLVASAQFEPLTFTEHVAIQPEHHTSRHESAYDFSTDSLFSSRMSQDSGFSDRDSGIYSMSDSLDSRRNSWSSRDHRLDFISDSASRLSIGTDFPHIKRLAANRSSTIPYQNVFQAREELEMKTSEKKRDPFLSKYFDNRKIKFLVDNSDTMIPFWQEASELLGVLAWKARGQHEDGMDLSFTSGGVKVNGWDAKDNLFSTFREDPFRAAMKRPDVRPTPGRQTDIAQSFRNVLHLAEFRKNIRMPKTNGLTIIVFTDGIWGGTPDKEEVKGMIVRFVTNLGKASMHTRFSIQFVQFGNDPDASHLLQILDDEMVYEGIPDIIDTEHSSGNVIKMLLGSFVPQIDIEEADDTSYMTTPFTPANQLQHKLARSNAPSNPISRVNTFVSRTSRLDPLAEGDPFGGLRLLGSRTTEIQKETKGI